MASLNASLYPTQFKGLDCNDLVNTISTFNQSIWQGDSLKSEYDPSNFINICSYNFTTFPPTTLTPSTISPNTTTPSTTEPTTTGPTTTPPSTQPSTLIPTSSCVYVVPNCEQCGSSSINVNPNENNISCVFISNSWRYSFKNKNSDTVQVTTNVNVDQNALIFIEGNFNQQPSTTISINLTKKTKKKQSNADSLFTVNGCVNLNGEIDLVLNERPSSDQTIDLPLFSYNCTQNVQLTDSQVKVSTNYQDSKCDVTSKRINNQQNSL